MYELLQWVSSYSEINIDRDLAEFCYNCRVVVVVSVIVVVVS